MSLAIFSVTMIPGLVVVTQRTVALREVVKADVVVFWRIELDLLLGLERHRV